MASPIWLWLVMYRQRNGQCVNEKNRYEHLKYFDEALMAYQNAHEVSVEELGKEHPLTSKIAVSVRQIRRQLGAKAGGSFKAPKAPAAKQGAAVPASGDGGGQ